MAQRHPDQDAADDIVHDAIMDAFDTGGHDDNSLCELVRELWQEHKDRLIELEKDEETE